MNKKYLIFSFLFVLMSCNSLKKTTQISFPKEKNPVITLQSSQNLYSDLSEPSICINKSNTQNIVAGSIFDNVYVSENQGKTWTHNRMHSTYGVFGDPCLASDHQGNLYYLHLADPDQDRNSKEFLSSIVIQHSTDNGKTWDMGTAIGYNPKTIQDKHWIGIDPVSGALAVTWTEFDAYESKNPNDHSRILFSRSDDHGKTWSKPISISQFEGDCLDDDDTTEGAVPVFDKKGNIYVAWAWNNKIYFDKSTDGGKTWLDEDIVIANQPEGWNYSVPGVFRANGMPVLCIDNSDSPYAGTLYVNWSDQRNGTNDTDIFISKSIDGGKTWQKAKRVNTDKTKTHQFLTWMSLDPTTGFIYIVYYDRSRYKDNKTDVFLAFSTNGGKDFNGSVISEKPFTPLQNYFMGDYNNIDAYNGIVTPIWTDFDKNVLSIKTAVYRFQ